MITENVTLSNAQECQIQNRKHFDTGLTLIGLSGTGPCCSVFPSGTTLQNKQKLHKPGDLGPESI